MKITRRKKISWHCPFNIAAAIAAAALTVQGYRFLILLFIAAAGVYFAASTPVVAAVALAIGPGVYSTLSPVWIFLDMQCSSNTCLFLARVGPPSSRGLYEHTATLTVRVTEDMSLLPCPWSRNSATCQWLSVALRARIIYFDPPNRPSVHCNENTIYIFLFW